MMGSDDRSALTAQVVTLLDESYQAYTRGDRATFSDKLNQAIAADSFCVSVIRGGILIGEIPNPDRDPEGWRRYVAATVEANQ